ncbi:hypothetical protein LTR37_021397 [Vermiconidia calcicola]|uniref:Uncharacterized protein n=1 Tax=Vermiconidia calcicola TaxID=1690605 RepID=A0ACC3M8P7_9PEZI|nr:hypothetical protein LTR37_021397 [Vermiconidia calcicola]
MSVLSRAPTSEKGARYLGQLDEALCNGNWSEIQELARKTDKHAPERKCLTLAARSEAQIASASHRPTSASSGAGTSIHGLGELVPKLREAVEAEKRYLEDAYAATVCLAGIHWLREDSQAALEALSQGGLTGKGGGSHVTALGWVEVCDVKSSLVKAASLEADGKEDEARQLYLYAAAQGRGSRSPELRRWTERLLARACMFMKRRASPPTVPTLSDSLRCFSAWSDFWQRSPAASGSSVIPSHLDTPRRQVWRAYYELLSTILQSGMMYNLPSSSYSDLLTVPSDDMSDEQYTSARLRQRAALQQAEMTYESLLLNETQFPKASQSNTEVEDWVELVVSNWKVFCGSGWTDSELGAGGKESVGRGVLDILYRAATKTFHSTAILRQLFTAHAALGEFDLAMHAFNSYVEIVSKGKARAEKTGKHEIGFDSEDITVLTAVEAVRVLCRYGDREQAKKAIEVGRTIQGWLKLNESPGQEQHPTSPASASRLQPTTVAAALRAIGTSQAHWARLTYETDSRSTLQADAVQNFRRAQSFDQGDIDTAYPFALVLAETRDVVSATETIKQAIASPDPSNGEKEAVEESSNFDRVRQLVPLWHLLALCLTAMDDFEQASSMCQAAFEQFGDPVVLFSDSSDRASMESEKPTTRSVRGLVDQMEGSEKEGILQVKITQLALIELMEGAEAAVDLSHELLGLYARLFGKPDLAKPFTKPPPTPTSSTPSKKPGTLRSLAGSMRPRSSRNSVEKGTQRPASMGSSPAARTSGSADRPHSTANGQAIGAPIAITVTNEDGEPTEKSHHHHFPFKLRGHQGDWREHGNLKATKSSEDLREKPSPISEEEIPPVPPLPTNTSRAVEHGTKPPKASTPIKAAVKQSAASNSPASPEQPLDRIAHNAPQDTWPSPAGHSDQPPRQDIRLPAPHPASAASPERRFPSAQERQHRISVLVKVWLFIGGLYLRADLFDDAGDAVNEAFKLVESFEVEFGGKQVSARRLFHKGWAGGKSVDELWADVWAAKGDLASARGQPFQAIDAYEQSLAHYPDHVDGTIGLSNILMDIFEEKIPAEEPRPRLQSTSSTSSSAPSNIPSRPALASDSSTPSQAPNTSKPKPIHQGPTPAELNRLAARDRAYMLLSSLTHLGKGWDNSEAWYTLARAHELSKQIGKAKQALWWVVELEENKPVRPWSEVSAGGFTV